MRLRDRIRHRIRTVLGVSANASDGGRASSFPFISGDTYRAVCDVILEEEAHLLRLKSVANMDPLIFVRTDLVPLFMEAVEDDLARRARLVIHNGDWLPTELLERSAHRFRRVHSVNWLGDRNLVNPLPIGLENAWRGVNGRWSLFADCIPAERPARLRAVRELDALLAFNDGTCPDVRLQARAVFSGDTRLSVAAPQRLTPAQYHRELRRTLFVPSPRGNGVDCHRTWEAIYAGAVPVVLRSDWPFQHLNLPVLCVDDWDEALRQISGNARDLHAKILAQSSDQVFALGFLEQLAK